jgi:hypothetical protein
MAITAINGTGEEADPDTVRRRGRTLMRDGTAELVHTSRRQEDTTSLTETGHHWRYALLGEL